MEDTVSFFSWIAALSPWWWVAFGIALGAIEMATMSFFLIWPALAALLMAGVVAIAPPMSGEMIVALWAILSIALTFLGRSLMHRYGDGGEPESNLNSRSARLVGRKAQVLDWAHGEGSVEIDGMRWKAISENRDAAALAGPVEIISADGMTLTVRG